MERTKLVVFWVVVIGIMFGASYIMFLGFNEAVGNPLVTVLVILAIWVVGLLGLG